MSLEKKKDTAKENGASIFERMEASAFRILAIRSHSRAELRRKLFQRKFPTERIEVLLDRLESKGYLNDSEAARSWVSRRVRSRPMGRRSMAEELRGLGIHDSIIESVIREAYGGGAELEHARRAAGKKLKGLEGKDMLRERLLRFLQGRGFSAQICIQAADEVLNYPKQNGVCLSREPGGPFLMPGE